MVSVDDGGSPRLQLDRLEQLVGPSEQSAEIIPLGAVNREREADRNRENGVPNTRNCDEQAPRAAKPTMPSDHAENTADPDLLVWTSCWFLKAPVVEGDAGEKEGDGVVHEHMVPGWDVDLGREWTEPPVFKPNRFVKEWVMNLLQPLPQVVLAMYWSCKGDSAPWRAFDGFVVTSEHLQDQQALETGQPSLERGKNSSRMYAIFVPIFVLIRWVPGLLCIFVFDDLREAQLVPLAVAYAALHAVLINQVAAKVAFQARSANTRLQSAFERRKNEFLTGWLIGALDVAIFEVRLAAARVGLHLEDRLTFECSVAEMRHFLAPVLHTLDPPDRFGRRAKEGLVLQALRHTVEGAGQRPVAHVLEKLDTSELVRAEADGLVGQRSELCSAPVKLVLLRILWHALQRDGSYRQQTAGGVHSNIVGGPLGALAQASMLLTFILAPHVVRLIGEAEPLKATQIAFCTLSGLGFVMGSNLIFQFATSSVFDLARRRHLVAACRALIAGSVQDTEPDLRRCVRDQAASGLGTSATVKFPRIAFDPETLLVWGKTLRTSRYLAQHFFRRTEVLLVYILLLFGSVFTYLWYLQLGSQPLSDSSIGLVYAALVIFWGGVFLCICTFHAAAANDDFRFAILDLNWRKQEIIASHSHFQRTEEHSSKQATGVYESAGMTLLGSRSHQRLLEASAAVDTAVAICERSQDTESLSVFGVRLGHQFLSSVIVVTAGQILLFAQLVLSYLNIEMIVTSDL